MRQITDDGRYCEPDGAVGPPAIHTEASCILCVCNRPTCREYTAIISFDFLIVTNRSHNSPTSAGGGHLYVWVDVVTDTYGGGGGGRCSKIYPQN